MNRTECDILIQLTKEPFSTQRELAEACGYSLGCINSSIKSLMKKGYIDEKIRVTNLALTYLSKKVPVNAVILAAGFGMRMVPINTEIPKGLLEIHGEALIERLIRQLRESGIQKIYIVVGFMKEQYEYLIDKYQVELIVNADYAIKNNMHSLKKVSAHLSNTYIIPCDLWCKNNPFYKYELYSWYMVSRKTDADSMVRINRNRELVFAGEKMLGNTMLGICYLEEQEAEVVRTRLNRFCRDNTYDNAFWEQTICNKNKMIIQAKLVETDDVVEINTYEQLRELDSNSNQLKSDAIVTISDALKVRSIDIKNIVTLKKGMTNRSFLFECMGKKYIMRIPGEGTKFLINRENEANVYREISGKNICDDNIYINEKNGYKITAYLENSRVCNSQDILDVYKCMEKLRKFHEMKLKVQHEFCLFDQINFYESLWQDKQSVYKDYYETKRQIFSLKEYIEAHVEEKVLTHIDAVPDNFLFVQDDKGKEQIYLIDWEYSGMQDPHVDIAMFGIYALYDKEQMDNLIDIYFQGKCLTKTRIKIYCYVATCGLLWSNWCEYKRNLGVDFGEYSLKQYRYAKEYYRIVCDELGENRRKWHIE